MKKSELRKLIKISYEQVALQGRDVARIYLAVVELDRQVLALKKQPEAEETFTEESDPSPAES